MSPELTPRSQRGERAGATPDKSAGQAGCRGGPDQTKSAEEDRLIPAARFLAARLRGDRDLLIDGCPRKSHRKSPPRIRASRGLWVPAVSLAVGGPPGSPAKDWAAKPRAPRKPLGCLLGNGRNWARGQISKSA